MEQDKQSTVVPQEQIDAVLDAALDELDEEEEEEPEATVAAHSDSASAAEPASPRAEAPVSAQPASKSGRGPVHGPERPVDVAGFDDMMKQLMGSSGEVGGEELSAFMQQIQSQLAAELEGTETTKPESSPKVSSDEKQPSSQSKKGPVESGSDVDRTISKLLEDMAVQQPVGEGSTEDEDEDVLNDMMKEFEKMGGAFGSDDVIDGMMQQLLSKELMYEPMKQVTEKFPAWLDEHKESLSEDQYKQRTQQYACFKQLIVVYEQEPSNTEKLIELMQEVQEYGQPPPEIIKDIAPGLELDSDGVPKLDATGMPLGSNGEDCRIM